MKRIKKLLSLALVMALALSMNITSFATGSHGRPVSSREVTVGDATVYVGSQQAKFYKDTNESGVEESQVYIRAQLEDATEYDLFDEIIINTTATVTSNNLDLAPTATGYKSEAVDLYNQAYEIVIGGTSCILAVGLPNGEIDTEVGELGVTAVTLGGKEATITGTNVENPFEGNLYYEENDLGGWTNLSFNVSAEDLPSSTNLSDVSGTITLTDSEATVGGCASASESGYSFDLSSNQPTFTVEKDDVVRSYIVTVTVASNNMQVTYAINLSEVVGSSYYTGNIVTQCTEILNGAEGYFNSIGATNVTKTSNSVSANISVPVGTDAMQPMLDLTTWANANNKFSYATSNSGTYLATLDGLGEFSCGNLSGWMYMNGPYASDCKGPNVGAASYTMVDGGTITWYMTTNYFNHF